VLSDAPCWVLGGDLEFDLEEVERIHAEGGDDPGTKPCSCMVLLEKLVKSRRNAYGLHSHQRSCWEEARRLRRFGHPIVRCELDGLP